MAECVEFIVVGAGMAGASAAFELSKHGSVILLERESQPGYHTTGRSAAVFSEIYGNATIRALTLASGPFFSAPPQGFSDVPLWSPRPLIMLAREDQMDELRQLYNAAVALVPTIRLIDAAEVIERIPVLRSGYVAGGLLEDSSSDLDVNAIHMGFLRGARARGVNVVTKAEVLSLTRTGENWRVVTSAGEFTARTVVNAAGAWADELAAMAGAQPVGLEPMRRTAFTFSFDPPQQGEHWPTIIDISEEFYFKPESRKVPGLACGRNRVAALRCSAGGARYRHRHRPHRQCLQRFHPLAAQQVGGPAQLRCRSHAGRGLR